ncbi:MAG TPA: glutamyl-tRNA reductase [Streptosporangiaceae bacterium]|nr:glutamyl-tRNA reductase [Streptosporangiaceae bacterium]
MSVLVVGLNHKGAPLATLERVALVGDALDKLLHDVFRADDVAGALVLSTCNRVEIYAEVGKFHGAVAAICELLSRHSEVPQAELTRYLYVHYEDRAQQHMLAVACGLDSMVVGESQILGQLRQALRIAREKGTLGPTLSALGSRALRAGKRAQSETRVGRTGASLVSVGLQTAARHLDTSPAAGSDMAAEPPSLAGLDVLIVGAGAMSGLAVASVARAGAASIVVANRTRQRAERLAASVGGRAADISGLTDLIAAADLVVTCTGAADHVITRDMVRAALERRSEHGRSEHDRSEHGGQAQNPDPQAASAAAGPSRSALPGTPAVVLLDLAMPRDVEPSVGGLPGVVLTDLAMLADEGRAALGAALAAGDGGAGEGGVAEVRQIIAEELAAHSSASRAASVSPTVVALRAKAASVVDAEMARLAGRVSALDARAMDEVAKSMRRVTDKLLHGPTVRVKELAGAPGADTYEDALRVLFDLDQATVQAVAQADAQLAGWPSPAADQTDREDLR